MEAVRYAQQHLSVINIENDSANEIDADNNIKMFKIFSDMGRICYV